MMSLPQKFVICVIALFCNPRAEGFVFLALLSHSQFLLRFAYLLSVPLAILVLSLLATPWLFRIRAKDEFFKCSLLAFFPF